VWEEVWLVFEAAEEGDDLGWRGFGMLTHAATKDVLGDAGAGLLARGFVDGTETLAHVLAERGFVVHAKSLKRTGVSALPFQSSSGF
jgi:hypothetical protein